MKSLFYSLISLTLLGFAASGAVVSSALPETSTLPPAQLDTDYGKLPLNFEANQGQHPREVKFLARGPGYKLSLTSAAAVLHLSHVVPGSASVVRMTWQGSNPAAPEGLDLLPGKSHYLLGKDPRRWHTDVAHYAKVRYPNIYPGIDIAYYGNQRELEYDLIVAPGADPALIKLAFQGITDAVIDDQGDLVMGTAQGEVIQRKPVIYQEIDGLRAPVAGRYTMAADTPGRQENSYHVGFEIGAYDTNEPLIIDPLIAYSTYHGGTSRNDRGQGIAVDAAGNVYITGETGVNDTVPLPTTARAFDREYNGGRDAFVTKYNPAGNILLYSTFLGGSLFDKGQDIAVDSSGNAYVTGSTASADFPTQSPIVGTYSDGGSDIFIAKLNSLGNALLYSTFMGGIGDDAGYAIAVDSGRNAYIAGSIGSDGFLTKLNAAGSAVSYSRMLAGSGFDIARDVALDTLGNAYVTGTTVSPDFPVTSGAFDTTCGTDGNCNGGFQGDAFFVQLNTTVSGAASLRYATFLGGSGLDEGNGIARDQGGQVYVTGTTDSRDFPTVSPVQASLGGLSDAFALRFNPSLRGTNALRYSTYLGGAGWDEGNGIGAHRGQAYVTGTTRSADFPTTPGAFDTTCSVEGSCRSGIPWGSDAFLSRLNSTGNGLLYSTFIGGGNYDGANAIAVDNTGNAYITGETNSMDFPTVSALQSTSGGESDVFVVKLADPRVQFSAASYSVNEAAGSVTITVTRVGSKFGAIAVNYATSGGSATVGADYTARNGTLQFANGDGNPKTFTIPISQDTQTESTETVNITLNAPSGGATLGVPGSAILTLIDND